MVAARRLERRPRNQIYVAPTRGPTVTLPTGLLPVLAFALTVGVATPVALGAHLFYRRGNGSFAAALRAALLEAGVLYLVGVVVIWAIAGGLALWEVAAALLVAGVVAFVVLAALPLVVGRRLVRRARAVGSDTALRYATYGWPVAALVVFGIFVAPGGVAGGTLLALGGERTCLAGHCGIARSFVAAVLLELLAAVLGPGVVGLALYSARAKTRGRRTDS